MQHLHYYKQKRLITGTEKTDWQSRSILSIGNILVLQRIAYAWMRIRSGNSLHEFRNGSLEIIVFGYLLSLLVSDHLHFHTPRFECLDIKCTIKAADITAKIVRELIPAFLSEVLAS